MNDELDQTQGNAEIIRPTNNRVEVSADLLNEAVTQLRKMAEIRQRDSERQERAIAQMQTSLKRQGILSRYVVLCCLFVVLVSIGLAYLMRQSAISERATASALSGASDQLSTATRTISEETQKQVTTLQAVTEELKATRETQASVVSKVDEQLGAVRQERDQVRGEVRNLLEEKTDLFIKKELELQAEREAIKEAKRRSKEEQQQLIQQTIERLNAMSASLAAEESAPETLTESVKAVVAEAEQVIAAETPAEPAQEKTVEPTAPAAAPESSAAPSPDAAAQ